jgi:hypothetical protein
LYEMSYLVVVVSGSPRVGFLEVWSWAPTRLGSKARCAVPAFLQLMLFPPT